MLPLRSSNPEPLMSALGQQRTLKRLRPMSALPPKADIAECRFHVRFVPKADIRVPASIEACTAELRT